MDYQICNTCVLDTTDPNISFDSNGLCQYCVMLIPLYEKSHAKSAEEIEIQLDRAKQIIKKRARDQQYDCLLGMSGGVDSSFAAYFVVVKMGLKPLIVHFDNGWNSALAVQNIKKIVKQLQLDLVTYVMDWEEFRDLQRAFFYASVLDIEMLTDNAIFGATIKIAKQHHIKYIVSGDNFATESGLPNAWRWDKLDAKNIKSIHKQYGKIKLNSFPIYSPMQFVKDRLISGIHYFQPLNIISFTKTAAMQLLQKEFDWQYYGGKHYESIFTKFYQAYILPTKFGIDKRRAHLSSLIRNQEMTRSEALVALSEPLYDPLKLQQDLTYIQQKLGFTAQELMDIMKIAPRKHTDFPTDSYLLARLKRISSWINYRKNKFS